MAVRPFAPRAGMARGVAAGSNRLVRPAPARPAKPESTLPIGLAQCEHQTARFRHSERNQPGFLIPFLPSLAASVRACVCSTTKSACASRQSVMNRCHASHVRTS